MMSHFLLIWQRDQHAILPKLQLEFRMSPRLPFAQAVERWHDGPIAAHISRDASDDYPVPFCHADGEHVVFFHGRLDYQDQLRRDLQMPMGSAPALLLAAYDKWGKVAFEKLYGSFVAVIYNTQHQSLLCVRDALGDCALYYYIDNATVVIALQPQMILAHPHVASTLNLKAVAHFLAGQSPNSAETIFQQVQQLPPAHTLRIDRQQTQQMRYWQLPAQQTCRLPSDAAYATQFREHLTNSVHNCTQVVSSFGVKMSGGLDSNALAALSAQTGAAPTTFSFVFNRFPHSNEARFIDATNAFLQLPHRQVVCDSQYPWSQLETWPLDPNHPFSDPYERMSQAVYRAARSRGIRVLLAGYYGDTLYQRAVRWIGALLRGGRVGRISAELFQQLRSSEGWRHPFFRQGLSCLVRKPSVPKFAWLRNEFRPISNHHTHFETGNLQIALSKSAMAAMAGIDLRYPYRDRRLLSFMAAIPPDQLYSHLWQKIIARRAMRGLLPDTVRWRQQETTLTPLFEHGLQAEIKTIYHIVAAPDALWRQVVQPKILPTQEAPFSNWLQATNDWGKLLIWRFALLELWRKRFNYE